MSMFTNKRIMVVAAHPDDELLGLGATMHKLIKTQGVQTRVIILGEGITSRSDTRDTEQWKEVLERHHQNVETALYAGVMLFVSSKVIDSVLYGMDTGRFMMIVSSQPELLAKHINEDIRRGVTLLHATGAYTGDSRRMLVCAVRRHEVFRVRSLVKQMDQSSFMIIGEASEILGEGFKPLEEEDQ